MRSSNYDLHAVAQYVSTTQGKAFAINDYLRCASDELLIHHPELQPWYDENKDRPHKKLMALYEKARELKKAKGEPLLHDILAKLDCPLYLSTNYDGLLYEALEREGKEPQKHLPSWTDNHLGDFDDEESHMEFSAEKPMVSQLFGHLEDKKSMVLTEDDYFQYLIGATKSQSRPRPSAIQERLTDSGLMFLGFRMESWQFRVLIHLLQSLQGSKLRGFYKNVAVQVDPEEGLGIDLDKVRKYLEKYFGAPAMQIEVYWGSAEDFLTELGEQ